MEVTNANWGKILVDQSLCLNVNDTVIFTINGKVICYNVEHNHLNNKHGINNAQIFDELGLYSDQKRYEFCSFYYGYPVDSGVWPECNWSDFNAITKLVIGIYRKIEAVSDKEIEPLSLDSTSKEKSISIEPTIKDIDTIKITISPTKPFKIIL